MNAFATDDSWLKTKLAGGITDWQDVSAIDTYPTTMHEQHSVDPEEPVLVKTVHIKLDENVLTDGLARPYDTAVLVSKFFGSPEDMVRDMLQDHFVTITEMEEVAYNSSVSNERFDKSFNQTMIANLYDTIENVFETEDGEAFDAAAYSHAVHVEGDKVLDAMLAIKSNIDLRINLREMSAKEFGATEDYTSCNIDVHSSGNPIDNHLVIEYSVYK